MKTYWKSILGAVIVATSAILTARGINVPPELLQSVIHDLFNIVLPIAGAVAGTALSIQETKDAAKKRSKN